MSEEDKPNEEKLVTVGRRDLVSIVAANPLVSCGIADLAKNGLLSVGEANLLVSSDSQNYINRDSIWMLKKEYDKAIKDYDQAIRHNPSGVAAYNLRGLAWWYKKEYDKAIADHSEAIRLLPSYAVFYNNRGIALRDKKEFNAALMDFDLAVLLDPNYAEAFKNRGMAWWARKDDDHAIKDFDEAIRLDPNAAACHLIRGEFWFMKGEYDRAFSDLDRAIQLNPVAEAFFCRGLAWLTKGNYDEGVYDICCANTRNSKDADEYWTEAIAWLQKIDDSESRPKDPRIAELFYNRGLHWLVKKEYANVVKDFDEAIRHDPTCAFDEDVYGTMAWLLATCPDEKLRDGKRAIQLATKACEITDWEYSSHLTTLAAAYAEAGRFDEAIRYQTKALEIYSMSLDHATGDREGHRKRLELYEQKKPYRQET